MKLEEISHRDFRWINIKEPDQEMVDFLKKNFHFHPLDLEDIVSKVQYPKVDAYQDYLYVMLQFPSYEEAARIYKRSELNVFYGKNYLITINSRPLAPLQSFFKNCQTDPLTREKYMGRGPGHLLYEIVDSLMDYVFPIINEKNETIFELEEEIFETSEYNDMIEEIMVLKRNLINIRRILVPQRSVLVDLGNKYKALIGDELRIYFDDLVDKKDKIINQLDTARAYVDVLEQANEALLTRSTNKVIKTLTVFSVIVLPANLLINYYGMNVVTPAQNSPHILFYLNTIFLASFVILFWFFAKKRWL